MSWPDVLNAPLSHASFYSMVKYGETAEVVRAWGSAPESSASIEAPYEAGSWGLVAATEDKQKTDYAGDVLAREVPGRPCPMGSR
jgi:hypothetical protein